MNNDLQNIISLINETGDKVIIYDKEDFNSSCVIMSINQYTALVKKKLLIKDKKIDSKMSNINNLTGDDLTDKINRDILNWRNEESGPFLNEQNQPRNPWAIPDKIKNAAQK